MRVFPYSVAVACLTIFTMAGCNDLSQSSSTVSIAAALRGARRSPESSTGTRIQGVVSYVDSKTRDIVVEDPTGGIRLAIGPQAAPSVGDLVEATGLLQVTGEAGVMIEPAVVILGKSKRPAAIRVTLENPAGHTNQTVYLRGVVESIEMERSGVQSVILRSSGQRAVLSAVLELRDLEELVDAEIEVTGVLVRGPSAVRDPLIWSRDPLDVNVWKPACARDSIPVTSIADVVKTAAARVPSHRVRMQGSSIVSPDNTFYLRDATGSVRVNFNSNSDVPVPGVGITDLIGFLNYVDGEPRLEEAEPVVRAGGGIQSFRTARDIHLLSYHSAALHQPVDLRAVVTFYNPPLLFVQDSTDGIFVESKVPKQAPKTGDLVEIHGVTVPGDFAPDVGRSQIRIIGRAPLPAPVTDIESVFNGHQDCRWVTLGAVVQKVDVIPNDVLLSLVWGNHAFKAHVARTAGGHLDALLDRDIDISGAVGALYNDSHQFLGIQLFVPGVEFITIKDSAAPIPAAAVRSIKSLLQFSPTDTGNHRVKVEGTVTLTNPSGPTWIRDNSGGLEIVSHQKIALRPGDVVNVLGFPQAKSFGPAMWDAQLTKLRSGISPGPIRISVDEGMRGTFESQLVEIEGDVVGSSLRAASRSLTMRADPYVFDARFASLVNPEALAGVSQGAHVLVRGILSVNVDQRHDTIEASGFQIVMRSPEDLIVVKGAPWLTADRLGFVLTGTLLVILVTVCWIMLLRRSVGIQTRTLVQKTSELQSANEIANDALKRAREAEAVESDRKAILELVAKDEPLECIMRAICGAAARHLNLAGCSVQLNVAQECRMSESSNIPESIAAKLSNCSIDRIRESRGFAPISALNSEPVWMAALPLLRETGLNQYCASAIRRGRKTAGFLVGFAGAKPMGSSQLPGLAQDLESWSGIASLAVERRGFFEQLSYRAQHDNLTGMVNRASLYERLVMELTKAAQEGKGLSVIYLDLDGFKNINDDHGHDAGDAVLREVARRLQHSVRRTDIAARLGGDEFVVLLPGVDTRKEAMQLGRLITDALRPPISFGNVQLETGSSLGIAVYPADGLDAETLLKSADQEMYRQKGCRKTLAVEHGVRV